MKGGTTPIANVDCKSNQTRLRARDRTLTKEVLLPREGEAGDSRRSGASKSLASNLFDPFARRQKRQKIEIKQTNRQTHKQTDKPTKGEWTGTQSKNPITKKCKRCVQRTDTSAHRWRQALQSHRPQRSSHFFTQQGRTTRTCT